tara:strand:- start:926 stop:1078 length:153 start_codon:yes stop_codon:yes gene_type:complete
MKKLLIILISIFLSGCIGETMATFGPLKIKPGDIATAPIKKVIMEKNDDR